MRYIVALFIANILWVGGATAQSNTPDASASFQQVTWQERDGLPQNSVGAVATRSDGYLWLGTYEGAVRFDGVRFTLFSPSTTTGIGTSWVTALLERRNGDLWLATYGGGVSRLSGGRFTQYSTRDGLSSDFVLCLFEDSAGTLWIGTDGGGVTALRGHHFTSYGVAQGLPSSLVRTMVGDETGALLVGTDRGLARIADGRVSRYDGPAVVANASIQRLTHSPDGSLWVAGTGGRLSRVDAHGVTEFGPEHGWQHSVVEALFADDDGSMWVGTTTQGLFHYRAGRFERYPLNGGVDGARVQVIARGRDDSLWIGTDGGLVRLKKPRVTVYTKQDGLASDFVGSIVQDGAGDVWMETGDTLTRFVNGVFQVPTADDGLPKGRSWLGSAADGFPLVYSTAGLARWKNGHFIAVDGLASIPWNRVTVALEDRSGTLWFGIRDGGLMRVRHGEITHLTAKDGLADDSVHILFEDRRGDLWVGTLRHGVTRISNGQLTSWSTSNGLAANHVKAFYEDASGTLWIGTHGGGLSRFRDGRLANITARQGLYNNHIFQILEDDDANLWMNCNTGIWRTSLRELNEVADGTRATVESFSYGTADGMISNEGVGANRAGSRTRDGSLWFPTTRGVVVIDPRRRDLEPSRVLIERSIIDREFVAGDGPVRLTPSQESLEIQYTGLNWSRPQAIRFRFRLMGLDRDWVDAGTRRTAYYSHLPPGSYTFHVTADNGDGVWNTTGATLAVVVVPRFYQTWWFAIAIAASAMALVWLSWRYRLAQLQRTQAEQQAFSRQLIDSQEQERRRIAAELHDSLGQHLIVIKNRALLGAMTATDERSRTQFDEFSGAVSQTLDEVRAISHDLRPPHLDQLGLRTALVAMIEQVADSSAIRFAHQLAPLDGLLPRGDEITLYRIVQECLNNILKHSGATAADITITTGNGELALTVHDNGHGFTAGGDLRRRIGLGLQGIAERVRILGGTHAIHSASGQGTTVRVRIPSRDPSATRE